MFIIYLCLYRNKIPIAQLSAWILALFANLRFTNSQLGLSHCYRRVVDVLTSTEQESRLSLLLICCHK